VSVAELSDVAGVEQRVEFPEGSYRITDDFRSNDINQKQLYRLYKNECGGADWPSPRKSLGGEQNTAAATCRSY
jgi:hypothetical protein